MIINVNNNVYKLYKMKKVTTLFFVALFISGAAIAQTTNCEVLMENLKGQYNGECKKGLANGEGAAQGIDSYHGSFKKGYPHGFGVYEYLDGSNYIGTFKKGLRDGYGIMNDMSSGNLIQYYGVWVADKLAIPNDARGLYKVDKLVGPSQIIPDVVRGNEYENQIFIEFTENGAPTKTATIKSFEISSGEYVENIDRTLNRTIQFTNIKEFPVKLKLNYIYKQIDWRKDDGELEVTLFVPGVWTIKLEHRH